MRNGGAIYKYLGVRLYKKYVPTSGDLITRARGIKRLKIEDFGRRGALEDHRRLTCVWERRHLISAVLLQSWAIFGGLKFGAENFWISSAINVFVNLYPIMLQRFNRVRIDLCLETMKPNKVL
jgi:glycosyl-4,4'-diaponeurosporenoate acyltransferase